MHTGNKNTITKKLGSGLAHSAYQEPECDCQVRAASRKTTVNQQEQPTKGREALTGLPVQLSGTSFHALAFLLVVFFGLANWGTNLPPEFCKETQE